MQVNWFINGDRESGCRSHRFIARTLWAIAFPDSIMKEEIRKKLAQLIGLQLTRTTRAANMECLKFGQHVIMDKVEGPLNIGTFGIHLQCPWRITKGSTILIGSYDVYEQADSNANYDPNFNWDRPNVNLRDTKLEQLISKSELIVEEIECDDLGGFTICFNETLKLSTFPATSSKYEYWRLLENQTTPDAHFVVGGDGIWESGKSNRPTT
jgi:hypothetical protein